MKASDPTPPDVSKVELGSVDAVLQGMELRNRHELTIDVTPIAGRVINGNMLTISTSIGSINFGEVAGFRSRGVMSNDHFTIGSHYAASDGNKYLGNDIVPGDIGWLPARREYTATQSSGVKYCAIFVKPAVLENTIQRLGLLKYSQVFKDQGFCNLPAGIARMLCVLLPAIKQKLLSPGGEILTENDAEELIEDVLEYFVQSVLGNAGHNSITLGLAPADKLLRELENSLASSQGELNISKFCKSMGISRRTLHRSIKAAGGCGPLDYQRAWKLAKVRNELVSGRFDTVTGAATRWGFHELGRFSQYYKGIFAELPSETLERIQENS